MTIGELYEWALTNDVLDYKIMIGTSLYTKYFLCEDDIEFDDTEKILHF